MSDSGRTMRTPLEIQLEHFRRRGVTTGDAIAELFQRCDEKDARIAELERRLGWVMAAEIGADLIAEHIEKDARIAELEQELQLERERDDHLDEVERREGRDETIRLTRREIAAVAEKEGQDE